MSNIELKRHKKEMEEQVRRWAIQTWYCIALSGNMPTFQAEAERTRRRWERNYSSDDSLVGTHDDNITVRGNACFPFFDQRCHMVLTPLATGVLLLVLLRAEPHLR